MTLKALNKQGAIEGVDTLSLFIDTKDFYSRLTFTAN